MSAESQAWELYCADPDHETRSAEPDWDNGPLATIESEEEPESVYICPACSRARRQQEQDEAESQAAADQELATADDALSKAEDKARAVLAGTAQFTDVELQKIAAHTVLRAAARQRSA